MLDYSVQMFNSNCMQFNDINSAIPTKLLIIISDGRGIFYEGIKSVQNSIQRTVRQKILTVFIILDIEEKNSIFEIKMPVFKDKNSVRFICNLKD